MTQKQQNRILISDVTRRHTTSHDVTRSHMTNGGDNEEKWKKWNLNEDRKPFTLFSLQTITDEQFNDKEELQKLNALRRCLQLIGLSPAMYQH